MLSGAKRAVIYLILAVALWGGVASRMAPCMPEEVMPCCVQETEQQCGMDQDCCRCGNAPARDLTIPSIVKPPRPAELPVASTFQPRSTFDQHYFVAGTATAVNCSILKPPRLYIINRSLLI